MNRSQSPASSHRRTLGAWLLTSFLAVLAATGCKSAEADARGRMLPFKVAVVPIALQKDGDSEKAIRYSVIREDEFLERIGVDVADGREGVLPVFFDEPADADHLQLDVAADADHAGAFGRELIAALTKTLYRGRFSSAVLLDYPRRADGTPVPLENFFALSPEEQQYYWQRAASANDADVILVPSLTISPVVGRKENAQNSVASTFAWFMIGPLAYLKPLRFDDQTYFVDAELHAELYDMGRLIYQSTQSKLGVLPFDPSARVAQFNTRVDRIDLDMFERKGYSGPTLAASMFVPPFLLGRGADEVGTQLRTQLIDQLAVGLSDQIDLRAMSILDDDSNHNCKLVGIRSYDAPILYRDEQSPGHFLVQGLVVPTHLPPVEREPVAAEANKPPKDGDIDREDFETVLAGVDVTKDVASIVEARAVRSKLSTTDTWGRPTPVLDEMRRDRLRGGVTRDAYFDDRSNATVINWRLPIPAELQPGVEPTLRIRVRAVDVDRWYTFAIPGAQRSDVPPVARIPTYEEYFERQASVAPVQPEPAPEPAAPAAEAAIAPAAVAPHAQ